MSLPLSIGERIREHLRSPVIRDRISDFQMQYREDDFAEISGFMPRDLHQAALDELESLFSTQSKRRDLTIRQSENTPRKLTILDRDTLNDGSRIIPSIFRARKLYELLELIVGESVHSVPYIPEEFIASRLHKAGDEHGWHWDDYTWALVWIFKMPGEDNGGSVEFVKRVQWNHANPQIEGIVERGPVLKRHPRVGSAYLLKADTALHRVSPLRESGERLIVCYSFASSGDLAHEVSHDSMEALYPDSHAKHGD